jgi:uncharacterized protein YhfF
VNSVPDRYQALRSFSFGDGAELADELLDLVLKGIKTATCSPDQRHVPLGIMGRTVMTATLANARTREFLRRQLQ